MKTSSNLIKGAKRQRLTKSIRLSAKTNSHRIHVLPSQGMWGIKFEGEDKLYRKYSEKKTAVKNARDEAVLRSISEIIIHDKDGRIASSISYPVKNGI